MDTPAESLTARTAGTRYVELDSLRGLAALSVVLHHLTFPFPSSYRFWTAPFLNGRSAVILFFVLSGFVLSLPFWNKGSSGNYLSYIIRRVFRVYLPFAASVAFSALVAIHFLYSKVPLGPWFRETWQTAITPHMIYEELLLPPSAALNTAYWSLRYEMQASIAFPAILLCIRRIGTISSLVLTAASYFLGNYLSVHGFVNWRGYQPSMRYLPMFVIGALLARHRLALRQAMQQLATGIRGLVLLTGVLLYVYSDARNPYLYNNLFRAEFLDTIAASIIIITAISVGSVRKLLSHKLPEYLGRVSYSVYLVHGTVLFAAFNILYGRVPIAVLAAIYMVVVFTLAHLFCVAIEEPLLRLGKRLSTRGRVPQS